MASEPIGMGEEKHPAGGNALLTTYDLGGKQVHTPLWIVQFATDLNLQVDSAQLRRGFVHRPVRFSERFLTFTTIWNVADRPKYLKLGDKIKQHWALNFNEDRPTPMVFKYYGASKAWKGFIENWETHYAITDVVLSYTFNMRIALTPEKGAGQDIEIASTSKTDIPFAPTAGQVKDYGKSWYTGTYFESKLKGKSANSGANSQGANQDSGTNNEDGAGYAGAGNIRKGQRSKYKDTDAGSDDGAAADIEDATSSTAGDQFKYISKYLVWNTSNSSEYFDTTGNTKDNKNDE